MGWESNNVFQVVIITGTTGSGLFVYSPATGAGNLVGSIVAAGGTDLFGNVYQPGITTYAKIGATFFAVSMQTGIIEYLTAASEAGPWSLHAQEQYNLASGTLFIGAPGAPALQVADGNIGIVNKLNLATTVSDSVLGSVFQITNSTASPTSPIEQIIAAAAADNALGIRISTDTINRLRIDSNGKIQWGPGGAVAVDTDLFRGGTGVLQTDSTLAITNQATPAVLAGAAQLFATAGQPAYENPQGLVANLSGGQLAAVNQNTVTQTVFTNLASATIPANDAEIGATYKFTAYGAGTWGSTQQQLTLAARFGATAATTASQAAIAATALAASAGFEWWAEAIFVNVTTGATATWQVLFRGTVTQTANAILPGTAADNTIPFASGTIPAIPFTKDSTIAETVGISALWASTTGAPMLTKTASFFERIA